MRRRITIAILGTVTAALVLTGLGTLGLDRISSRVQTEHDLQAQAQGLADLMVPAAEDGNLLVRPAVTRVLKGFKLEGIGFMYVSRRGVLVGTPPAGVDPTLINVTALEAGETIGGRRGSFVYAIAGSETTTGIILVAVLTRQVAGEPRALEWFALSAVVALILGGLVAFGVSRALTEPLRLAEEATHRIAGGDLSARVPEPAGGPAELGDLTRSINTMAEGLDRSRGLEQQFLLSVSHDLRTPLTSIRGYAEAITDGTAADAKPAAAVILSESRRLERLVRDLLDLARLDSRQFSLAFQVLPVTEVVTDTAEGFMRRAEEEGVTLVVDDDPGRTTASIDPDRLAQVVANLVENGLKYAVRNLRVSTTTDAESVFVVVADDGPGIAPADLPHVFERLYTARHQPARRESGSGLGLAIVRELVAAMGGAVRAESPIGPDGGTRILLRLPRAG